MARAAAMEAQVAAAKEKSAAEMAARMAGEKLGDTMTSGSRQLDLRTTAFEKRVEGLTSQLERLGDVVAKLQQDSAQQHGALVTGIQQVTSTNRLLSETTAHLREALASPKARGQWGERMADDVLRVAGMVEGISYRKQTGIDGGSIPDVTFLLPGGRELHMDVKFPVDNYLRHLEATTDHEREAVLPRLGAQHDREGRIPLDVDALERVHLNGDAKGHEGRFLPGICRGGIG